MVDPRAEVLEGRHLKLVPLGDADSPTLFRWINDRDLVQLSAPFRPVSQHAHDAWFESVRRRPDTRIFGIRLSGSNQLIGSCQLLNIHCPRGSAHLQIRIGEKTARGHGYGTEAVGLLVDYAFDQLRLERVELHVFATNKVARSVYLRAGFVEERVLPAAVVIDEKPVDVVLMSKAHR